MYFDRNINGDRDVKFLEWDYWSLHWRKNLTLAPHIKKLETYFALFIFLDFHTLWCSSICKTYQKWPQKAKNGQTLPLKKLILTFECTIARVSTQTLQPPYSNLMAWCSSILNRAKTISDIFASSAFFGWI